MKSLRWPFAYLLVGALLLVPAALAQYWKQKAPEKWSKKECEKFLSESPWAKSWERTLGGPTFRTVPVRVTYVAQLWSVRMVRQAIVRNAEHDDSYDTLTPEQKKAQDAEGKKFIAAEFPDTVIVQVVFGTNSQGGERELRNAWMNLNLTTLKESVSLSGPGGKVAPVGYTPPQGQQKEFQIVFPRQAGGRPIAEEGAEFLQLEFQDPARGILPQQKVLIRYEPKEMLVDGKLVY